MKQYITYPLVKIIISRKKLSLRKLAGSVDCEATLINFKILYVRRYVYSLNIHTIPKNKTEKISASNVRITNKLQQMSKHVLGCSD